MSGRSCFCCASAFCAIVLSVVGYRGYRVSFVARGGGIEVLTDLRCFLGMGERARHDPRKERWLGVHANMWHVHNQLSATQNAQTLCHSYRYKYLCNNSGSWSDFVEAEVRCEILIVALGLRVNNILSVDWLSSRNLLSGIHPPLLHHHHHHFDNEGPQDEYPKVPLHLSRISALVAPLLLEKGSLYVGAREPTYLNKKTRVYKLDLS